MKSHIKPQAAQEKRLRSHNNLPKLGVAASSIRLKLFGRADMPQTVQQSIPYKEMYRDGICRVTDRLYTKTLVFSDINYQLAQNEDKTQIFEGYCDFLNYFDASVSVQLTFVNRRAGARDFQNAIEIPSRDDGFNGIRREYSEMLKNQLARGNNGLVRSKYITFGIEADGLTVAKPRLERIEADIISNFKSLGVHARALSGLERLEVLHGQFHPDGSEKLQFDWSDIPKTGLTTKDFIAPTGFDFRDGRSFRMGSTIGAVSFVQIIAPELTDRMLADFLGMDEALTVNMHIRSIDQAEAIKTVKRKLSDLDAMKIAEQKKAVRSGYDMDVLPADLVTYGKEAQTLLNELQNRNERMFLVTVLVLNTAKKKQKLDNSIFAASGIAQKYNCALKRLDWQQEQGLMSSLPLGLNQIEIRRGLTTSSTAIFVPFTTMELFQDGEALYYGLNALSNNLIMANRKNLKNPNGLFLGTPGSGKSFSAKREMTNVFLLTDDDIIISDPESEYPPLVHQLGGQVIRLSPSSDQYLNPMDINPDYDDEDPLTLKSDFLLSLCELIVGGRNGLEPVERTIIDRCVRLVYRDYLQNPDSAQMPILEDLYNLLRIQPEPEAQRIATALEIYVTGSLNVFNHRTNVDVNNRLVCFDLKELGKSLKKIGMLILQDAVWNRVTVNRARSKATWFYIDEMHLLLKEEQTAAYTVEIWKRFRKWGGIPSGLTQNIKDLLASREIENIFEDILCKGWMSNPLLLQRRPAHSQRNEAVFRGGDIYIGWGNESFPHLFIRKKDRQRRYPRQSLAAAATHNARRRCKESITQFLPSFNPRCGDNERKDCMSCSIMEALFDGRVIPWERRSRMTDERKVVEEKIQREKRYFMEKMSLDDCQRLEGLENLYGEAAHHEEIEIYTHGFTLGALLMLEVMESKQAIINE